MTATSRPIGEGSPPIAPPSRRTTRPIPGRRCPASSGSSARAGMEPVCPQLRPVGLFLAAASSLRVLRKMPRFSTSRPPPPSRRPPVPRATSSVPRRCPSSPEKPSSDSRLLLAAFSVFPNPRASPPCRGCSGRSRGCPRHSQAVPGSGDNMVSAKWDAQK